MSYFGRPTWRTKEGKILYLSEMKTSHLENCLRMLEKQNEDEESIAELQVELEHRTRILLVLKEYMEKSE